MGQKITDYPTSLSAFGNGDLFDVSKKISSGPDVWESEKCDFATLKVAVADNIYIGDGSLSGNRSVYLSGYNLSFMGVGRVIINTALGSAKLEVAGGGITYATRLFNFKNNSPTDFFTLFNNGVFRIGNKLIDGNPAVGDSATLGGYLYSEGGNLIWKGSSGTTTVIATA